jgi:hypothetical protein
VGQSLWGLYPWGVCGKGRRPHVGLSFACCAVSSTGVWPGRK